MLVQYYPTPPRHDCVDMSTQSRSTTWCFTLNNPTEDEVLLPQSWDPETYKYLVYQLEQGENGTPHLQGYISFNNQKRFSEFRKYFVDERAHVAVAKGTAKQNRKYCTKEEGRIQGPWEFGVMPNPGKRTDLMQCKALLDSGATLKEVSESYFSQFVRYSKAFKEYALLHTVPRNWEMDIEVVYGSTGTGKSRYCYENYPDAYWKSKNSGQQQFWDGYNGEETIVIDEFYGWFSWDYLLRLTDRYPFSLDIKHGTVPLVARKIIFTSNKHPRDWYPNSKYGWDDSNPLKRRIKTIRELGPAQVSDDRIPTPSTPPVMTNEEWLEENRLLNLYRNL